jgi:uncharacterized protein (DUF1330 family)
MAAYVIGQVEIRDPEAYKAYAEQVPATIAKYDGEYLVRGGRMEILEGQWPQRRIVVLKFPSLERAREWYDSEDYAGPKGIRQSASVGDLMVVEGIVPDRS